MQRTSRHCPRPHYAPIVESLPWLCRGGRLPAHSEPEQKSYKQNESARITQEETQQKTAMLEEAWQCQEAPQVSWEACKAGGPGHQCGVEIKIYHVYLHTWGISTISLFQENASAGSKGEPSTGFAVLSRQLPQRLYLLLLIQLMLLLRCRAPSWDLT